MNVGIVGGGQLGRMLALAGYPLGARFRFLDPAEDACAAPLGSHLAADYDDEGALAGLAEWADVVTIEFENVSVEALERITGTVPVHPAPGSLAVARDRLEEKTLFDRLGIPTPAWAAVDDRAGLERAARTIGLPAVLKRRTLGYDGKGQEVVGDEGDLGAAWDRLGNLPLLLESFVAFDREVSVLAARARDGSTAFYPVSENTHEEGILRVSVSRPGDPAAEPARELSGRILDALDYVGVLALELFEKDGELLANEIAPRVHNSGHWSIEGARASQFENHLRAVLGLPLGDPSPVGLAAMVNFIGEIPPVEQVLAIPPAHLHVYDKAPRPGRKIGHATVRADDERELRTALDPLLELVGLPARSTRSRPPASGR
ncbi:MAG: 5-(carboxyamino)imidazole ribonucleotide synthase [Gemmatimonadota bacterium]|nr:5-(carboxyamino)imidazole ribonucleotide synthase [Gemmatimonadota bacterium]